MPIFEYTCSKCGKTFEKLVLGSRKEPPVCPHCGTQKVTQQLSTFAGHSTGAQSSGATCAHSGGG